MPVTVRLRKARHNTAHKAPQEERRMEQSIRSMAVETAQAFLRGEIEYEDAVAWMKRRLDPHREGHPDDVEKDAQEILDECIMNFWEEDGFWDALEKTAQEVVSGALEYYYATKRVQSRLHPLDRREDGSWDKANELLDWQIMKIK